MSDEERAKKAAEQEAAEQAQRERDAQAAVDAANEAATNETPEQKATADKSSKQADKAIRKETAQGFVGREVDVTPNENYTVAGVTAGKPTPETDEATAAKARKAAGLR